MHVRAERFVQGQVQRDSEWRVADLTIRKLAALEALARWGRKVSGRRSRCDRDRAEPVADLGGDRLVRSAQARAGPVHARRAHAAQAAQILRSRLNFQGTTMGFSTERTDDLWWLMVSADVNANRVLLAMLDQDKWREDMPRLVRGSLGRQQRGHWNTTVANAWGVLAMEQFAAAFETEPVTGATVGKLGQAGAQARLEQAGRRAAA